MANSEENILSRATYDKIFSSATPVNRDKFFIPINDTLNEYLIDKPLRIAAFCAQIIHESGSLKYVREIASGARYEGRKDLGNIQPGDGIKFAGRGLIQITGRSNYRALSNEFEVDFVNNPKLLEQPQYAALSAGWYWDSRNLNSFADEGDLKTITRKINGGLNGWEERLKYYNRIKLILGI